jgi:hypothetical protein
MHCVSPLRFRGAHRGADRSSTDEDQLDAPMAAVSLLVTCGLVAGVLLSVEAGHRLGIHRLQRERHPTVVPHVHPMIEASVFGLMGILIGFTFYGAASRFDNRRNLIVREANAIGTTYLRIDLLPPEFQPQLREDFRNYVHSRLAIYKEIPEAKAVTAAIDRSRSIQEKMWKDTVNALKESGPAEKSLMLTSMNEAIDITTDRTVALTTHAPLQVFVMLALSAIAASVLAGYTMSVSPVRDWVSMITLALVLGVALNVILDYEFPRFGLIRIDPVDQVLVDTLKHLK